jgi:3-methyladenine DNA glycosylase/8-oxoguanine DNA glycosylase
MRLRPDGPARQVLRQFAVHKKAIQHLRRADPILARIIDATGPCRLQPDHEQSPFEALVEAVCHQQLTGKAAQTILGRVKALHPHRPFPGPEDLLATPDEKLRAAGLSRAKTASVKDISAKTLEGIVPGTEEIAKLADDEIIERLTVIRGVGRWTVEMLLIFKLGRLDVLPVDDYGVRKGFGVAYRKRGLPKAAVLLKHGERWRPYRSIGAWYMWRAIELARQAKA